MALINSMSLRGKLTLAGEGKACCIAAQGLDRGSFHIRLDAGEHAIQWGAHAAQDRSTGLKPACQDRNACSSVSFNTATRTVNNG